ncbi:hypothetical protein N499_1162B, partial [Wolbachia pipientis wVitA]
LNPA